jgi:hypothetical protein
MMGIKYKTLKLFVKFRERWSRTKNNFMTPVGLTELQTKGIKIWYLSIKDKSGKLYHSDVTRLIERDNVLLIFKPVSHSDYGLTIIDSHGGRNNCYELTIPSNHSKEMCEEFDVEMERRMRLVEFNRRQVLNKDLDSLLNVR